MLAEPRGGCRAGALQGEVLVPPLASSPERIPSLPLASAQTGTASQYDGEESLVCVFSGCSLF